MMSAACQYETDVSDAQWELLHPVLPTPIWRPGGFVANFASGAVKEQLPLPVGGIGGQGVEHFGRSEALVSLFDHQLSFLHHVHEFDADERGLRRVKRFES